MRTSVVRTTDLVKHLVFFLLVFLMLFFTIGCEKKTDDVIEDKDIPIATKPTDLETITIYFWGYTDDGQPYNLTSINEMLEEVNKKTEAEINTKIKLAWIPYMVNGVESYVTKLKESMRSENGPDAFMAYSSIIEDLNKEDLVRDLTDLFPQYAPRYYSTCVDTWGSDLDYAYKINDMIYAVPANNFYTSRIAVVAREDLVQKYMPDGITDIDDYYDFLKAVKNNEDGIIPGKINPYDFFNAYISGKGYFGFGSFAYSKWDNAAIDPVFLHTTDEFKTADTMYRELWHSDILYDYREDTTLVTSNGSLASFLDGVESIADYYGGFTGSFKYQMYPLNMDVMYLKNSPGTYCLGISANSNKAERVLMFIEWLQSSQENYELFMYGIKDKHYKLTGDTIDTTLNRALGTDVYNWWGSDVFRNFMLIRKHPYEPEDYIQFRKDCAFKNTVAYEDLYLEKGYGPDVEFTEEEKTARQKKYESIRPSSEKINNEYFDYFDKLLRGLDGDKTLEQIIDEKGLQNDVSIMLDYFKSMLPKKD